MKDESMKEERFVIEPEARLISDDTPYMVPRSLLLNTTLSWKAKGVAAYIVAKKIISGKAITAAGKDGQAATYAAVQELEAAGLIERQVVKDDSGKIMASGYIWKGGWQ